MRLTVLDNERCIGCQSCMFACARRPGDGGLARSCIVVTSIGGMERGFKVIACRACVNPPCAGVCPVDALTPRDEGGVRLNLSKCIGCGRCASACMVGAVQWDDEINKPMICTHCGYCVDYCPHGVLAMEEIGDDGMLVNDPLANVLYIDLTRKRFRVQRREDLFERYLGGVGVATRLLLEECPEGVDPLAPDNPIIFAVGPLTGLFPLASKTVAMFKSPHTGNRREPCRRAQCGGHSHGGVRRHRHQGGERFAGLCGHR